MWREQALIVICVAVIFFLYIFEVQAHFSATSPQLDKIHHERMRVKYMQSGDFYPMSWKFPRLLNQIRASTRRYRAESFHREFGNYGTYDLQGAYNRHHQLGDPFPDSVGQLSRP